MALRGCQSQSCQSPHVDSPNLAPHTARCSQQPEGGGTGREGTSFLLRPEPGMSLRSDSATQSSWFLTSVPGTLPLPMSLADPCLPQDLVGGSDGELSHVGVKVASCGCAHRPLSTWGAADDGAWPSLGAQGLRAQAEAGSR